MNAIVTTSVAAGTASFLLSQFIIPRLIRVSEKWGMVDKPNYRKLHRKPVPVIGGLAVALTITMTVLFFSQTRSFITDAPVLPLCLVVIMLTGLWDDRKNISPRLRLLVQMVCATAIASSGIRITSLYGIFGMESIPLAAQYILTIIVITGTTNAFNLMDGIDGLAGGLAVIITGLLSALAFVLSLHALAVFLLIVTAAVAGFLRFNLHPARTFMGDAGSLTLGFLMAVSGILLIETNQQVGLVESSRLVLVVAALLLIPVFDSLRVYTGRIRRGLSPFHADKSHLHHLLLAVGLDHRSAALRIFLLEGTIVVAGLLLEHVTTLSLSVLVIALFFLVVCRFLLAQEALATWTRKIRQMETETSETL